MSVPYLISPLLDDFVMGDPISDHDGVRACPAMHMDTEEKYIVKVISLPASQSKLDALLLAGAFQDKESALAYFKELADGVVEEATLLQKLSKHDGFLSFASWQVVPMQGKETGYDIYLLSHYLPTLENVLHNNQMTHLQALNLGLDLCAALSATRRFGYIYANLRPSNVYLCNEREFRIGDLGFLSLDSLLYASLPDKYHSSYTPPEISDAFSTLNETMDTYAVGLILYQAYNNGELPSGVPTEAPCHADSDLAAIILKACASDPAERWADPVQMGQALAAYMQTHAVNDTPIAPPPVVEEIPEEKEIPSGEDAEPSTDTILAEVDQALETAPAIIPSAAPEAVETAETVEETVEEPDEEYVDEAEEVITAETPTEDLTEEIPAEAETTSVESEDPEEIPVESVEEIAEEVFEPEADEPAMTESEPEVIEAAEEESVEDTAQMLAQADDLIAHQLPDPPVAPDPIEVTLPVEEPAAEEIDAQADSPIAEETQEETTDTLEDEADEESTDDSPEEKPVTNSSHSSKKKKKSGKWGIWAAILAVVLLLGSGAVLFYQYYYLQTVYDMTLKGSEDKLTVTLVTNIVDEKLTVRCTDTHGNTLVSDVQNGMAHFTGLKSATAYKLEVRIDGFHKLLGETTCDYITTAQTVINGFFAAAGPETGSVILSFTPQGPSPSEWTVSYSAEGEESKSVTFAGHMVTLSGLTVGKEYTFTLKPNAQLYVSGTDTITFTVSDLVYAEDLKVEEFAGGKLTLSWKTPEGASVSQWFIHCYNDAGFDCTLSTAENTISFEGMDSSAGYTIEVTAEGMTLGSRINISANSIIISNIQLNASNGKLLVTWAIDGAIPEGGWQLQYSVDGSAEKQTINCADNACTINSLIPGGHYTITIEAANGTTAFGGTAEYDAPEAKPFDGYQVKASDMEFSMCKTPNKAVWDRNDVSSSQYTTSFKVGESASFVMHLSKKTTKTQDMVTTLYVLRDAEGNLMSAKEETRTWDEMWDNRYGELTIPVMPQTPGTYTVEIYFNGASATVQTFEILA